MPGRLFEVAQRAGVSEATVSRVLNDRPGIAASTRAAVLTALDVMGYERPTLLRGERARLVGLVVPDLQNPIFPAFADVIGGALAQRGFTAVLCSRAGSGISEADYVDLLLEHRVSGVVFVAGQYLEMDAPHEHYLRLLDLRLPVVLVNGPGAQPTFPTVSTDDAVAVEQAFGHLVSLGHRRIGLILGPPDHAVCRRKHEAFLAAAAREGIAVQDGRIAHTVFSIEGGQAAASRLLKQGVTGIVCASDQMALGAVRAARRAGLRVPRDVSIVGYDDSALMACTDPQLSTVHQPFKAIGNAAVAMLVSQIDGAAVAAQELLFEPELVARGSTGPAPLTAGAAALSDRA